MTIEENTINPVVNLLHNLFGKQLWILPTAVAIACWLFCWMGYEYFWLLFTALLCTIITSLLFLTAIAVKLKKWYNTHKLKIEKRNNDKKIAEQKRREIEYRHKKWADDVWKFVAHKKHELISCLPYFLELEIHDSNELVRFIHWPKDNDRDSKKIFDELHHLVLNLTFDIDHYTTIQLVRTENIQEGIYFYIDEYFYKLVKHYKETNKWEKV